MNPRPYYCADGTPQPEAYSFFEELLEYVPFAQRELLIEHEMSMSTRAWSAFMRSAGGPYQIPRTIVADAV